MSLDSQQQSLALEVWRAYAAGGQRFINASMEFTHEALDQRRRQVIPEVRGWLERFLGGQAPLEEFKTAVDGINKRNRLWGFRGINGQMFFNVLTKMSAAADGVPQLTKLLRRCLPTPGGPDEASDRIAEMRELTRGLARYSADPRGAPKVGSLPYFLSYFWQIQSPDEYPVYYTSMVEVLAERGIWSPSGDVGVDYRAFMGLNADLRDLFRSESGRDLHIWDVEHAFWFASQHQEVEAAGGVAAPGGREPEVGASGERPLPDSYIPPVVMVLPQLAANDEALGRRCENEGLSVEKTLENRAGVLFRMLGYEVDTLGQGHGRAPDGVAKSREYHYAIVYDTKARKEAYTMGTDDRAAKEYINSTGERLRKEGIKTLYFAIISSRFTGDHDDVIRGLKIETEAREVLLIEAAALLVLLEGKLRDPSLTLGPDGVQRLLASSGPVTEADAREFIGI
jgi:hypothetical protein